MTRRLDFFYDTLLEFQTPVTDHEFVLSCVPPSFPGQEIDVTDFTVEPGAKLSRQLDPFGNLLFYGCVPTPHTSFHYQVKGRAVIDHSKSDGEGLMPFYKYQSKYTKPSSEMLAFLRGLVLPSGTIERAWALAEAIYDYLTYLPGSTGTATKAEEAFSMKRGVCQDYAHIFLSLAREAGLTARYVSGLPEGSGETHAWCEVYADGKWVGIDPTRLKMADEGYIRIGVGRDFGDCPMERGVFHGVTDQDVKVYMQVSEQ